MQIMTATPTSKATASLIQNKNNKSSAYNRRNHKANATHSHSRRHSTNKTYHTLSDNEDVLEIVYSAPSDIITPPPSPKSSPSAASFTANDRILTARRHGQLKYLMAEYNSLKKEGLMLHDHTYNLVFESYANLRRDGTPLAPMLKIYDEMLESGIQPSSSTFSIIIRILCKRDVEVQKVIAMLKRQNARSYSKSSNNNMIELESEGNITRALAIFDTAIEQGLVQFFDAELYNQMLRVLSHYGNTKASIYIYEQLNLHVGPTSATFAALINLFGRVGDLSSALKYFEKYSELKDSFGHHDASYIYNALVDAHLKCNKLEGAIKIVKEDMVNCNIKMTTIPFNSIIRYYCLHNKMDEANELIESMKISSPEPDASSYGPILSTYCQLGSFKEASKSYQDLIKTDISKSYGNLANYALLCLKNEPLYVFQVLNDMRSSGLEPDPSLASRIVTHFVNAGDVAQAVRALRLVLESMKARSLSKGFNHIQNAATEIVLATKTSFAQTFEVARTIYPYCPQGLPLSIAKPLVENYEFDNDHSMLLQQSDYNVLFDASLVISPAEASNLASFQSLVFGFYSEMTEKGIHISSVMKARILSQLQTLGDKKAVKKWNSLFVVERAEQQAPTEAEEASAAVMKAAVHGQLQDALDILNTRIVEPRLTPVVEPIRDAIAFIGKQGHLDIAVTMYRLCIKCLKACSMESQQLSKAIYSMTNSILIGYAQQGDMLNAKKYYEQIKLMGRYPDGNGYASLLLGSAKCATDEATDALLIYDEAKRHDVKPTTFFYNVVISKLAKARKLESAMKLFEEMKQFNIAPNSITYGAIISACVRAGSETLACKLFNDMLASSSFQPRVGPFNNMIQFYVRQQPNRERALEYFAELRRRHIKPSPHTYKLLIEAYCVIAPYDMPTAHRMLSEMERRDSIHPQATHYAALIYSYGALQRDVQSASRLFEDMENKRIVKDEVVYQAMLDTLVSNDQLEEAEALYATMQQTIQRSSSPYIENIFIRGYGEKGLLEKAKSMFNAMDDDKENDADTVVIREPSTYEAMVRAYVDNKKMSEAKEIFDMMVQREFPEKVTASVAELLA
ncbi:hypothetical protein G6F46_000557 [Rhizopus delemar]|uniref:Pentacotripeptide-repeat region of PRORP domain-containing protein n=3 Tax=Rhizopus TaxID=4842 RepID=I1BN37_RHIO9|nr:hypothetical protein RO3G_02321 [Rhizopus delemar RA 99-880]KAG1465756.1 hypothetical protein G6F55_000935 [Rhizopus delemar]KAG1551481.1 hypothetical protein G6F51_001830 [Rhizopus arrhizus]KAG1505708.1 hypothetical protein G6F54_000123 [Rhizopus delemar]KAG1517425.1 hypothetical protein G6F53_001370 [Rhizopus delemar]|eukprot:EIE77617.1 hypothetical protein RO3G_02321 [Rhizopus delemar RA 99-880]